MPAPDPSTFLCSATVNFELPKGAAGASVGPGHVHAGTLWTGKKKAAQAIAWTIRGSEAIGCVLPAADFASSFANAVSGLDVVGTGEPAGDAPSRALLWWRGAAPASGGEALGDPPRAAMWQGSADSFVDLTPDGAPIATASACAAGFSRDGSRKRPDRSVSARGSGRAHPPNRWTCTRLSAATGRRPPYIARTSAAIVCCCSEPSRRSSKWAVSIRSWPSRLAGGSTGCRTCVSRSPESIVPR